MKDPIIEEVREFRMKHAQRFKFELPAICADLKKKEKEYKQKYGHPIKSLSPKTVQTAAVDKRIQRVRRTEHKF